MLLVLRVHVIQPLLYSDRYCTPTRTFYWGYAVSDTIMAASLPLSTLLGQPICAPLGYTCLRAEPQLHLICVFLVLFPGTVSVDVNFLPVSSSSLRRALRGSASVVHLQPQKPSADHVRADLRRCVSESILPLNICENE